jgi:hypothetical protein
MEPEVKDNCEQIIMKYYIEKKGMKLIDFTRTPLEHCESFEKPDIPIIDIETMNIEDILKKAIGYDTPLKIDETFVIEMTFVKKNGQTKLIEFTRREFDSNTDTNSDYTYDENGNPTHTQDILFKNTKKYKKYLELFEKINEDILFTLKPASTIEYLKSIKSTYYTKGDVINQIYNKMINIDKEQSIDNNPILKDYHLIIISIRDLITNYEILEKENEQLEKQKQNNDKGYYILPSEPSYNKYKDDLEKEKQSRIHKLNDIYDIKNTENNTENNAKDLPLFTEILEKINTSLGANYKEWYGRWYLMFHDKNTLKQGIKILSLNIMTPPPPPPPVNDS